MIKRIIVALDSDSDTQVATRHATEIAHRTGARITGLAVVDTQSIDSSARGGGIGSFYYAEKLKSKLTEESREAARSLIARFEKYMDKQDVEHVESVEEGVPFERIIEDLKYHDLLVIGKDPHFFYAHPKKETHTLARVVKNTISPTLIVGNSYHEVKNVVVAYDGSASAARSVQSLVQLRPFGDDISISLLNVYHGDSNESKLLLELLSKYLTAHGFESKSRSMEGRKPDEEIIKYATEMKADLIVAGAHAVSAIKRMAFGSTTSALLNDCDTPLFVDC
ncbi:MAG: universal stress protein [Rhodothermales bacterium]|nr:universal stress protein [Rhodothermales bacterium]